MGNNRNIARPNVVLTVTEEGTVEAIGRIKTQINNVADSLYNRLSAVGPNIANATGKSFLTMEQYIDRMLLKINSGLERGNFSATRERMLQDIQVIATALGRLDQQTASIGLGDISARMNLKAVAADIGVATVAMQKFKTEAVAAQERLANPARFTAAQNWIAQQPHGPFPDANSHDVAMRNWKTSHPEVLARQAAERRGRVGFGVDAEAMLAAQDLSNPADPAWVAEKAKQKALDARRIGAQTLLSRLGMKADMQDWRSSMPQLGAAHPPTSLDDFRASIHAAGDQARLLDFAKLRQQLPQYSKDEFDSHIATMRKMGEISLSRIPKGQLTPEEVIQAVKVGGTYHLGGKRTNVPSDIDNLQINQLIDQGMAETRSKDMYQGRLAAWKRDNPVYRNRRIDMLRRMAGDAGSHIVAGSVGEEQLLGGVVRRKADKHVADYENMQSHVETRSAPTPNYGPHLTANEQTIQQIRAQGSPLRLGIDPTDTYGRNGYAPRSDEANRRRIGRTLGFDPADDDLDVAGTSPSSYNRRQWEYPGSQKKGWRLSGQSSNRFRFAAQNVGFGVDDAIQSYQFGGAKASIRAASNNVTAIAGMLISNPIIAAASVIAISAASAALPTILSRLGIKDSLQSMTRTTRQELRNTDSAGYQEQYYRENYVSTQERHRKAGIAADALRSTDSYNAISSDSYGSDFSQRTRETAGFSDTLKRTKGSMETLEKRKSEERDRRQQQSQSSSNLNPLNWMMNASAITGNYETDLTKDIDKQLDALDKESVDLQDKVHISRSAVEEGQKKLAANMKMRQMNAHEEYNLSLRTGRGEMSLKELQSYHQKRAEQQREVARKELEGDHLQARLQEIDYQLAEKLNNPNEDQRRISLAALNYKDSVRSFNRSVSGDNSRTAAYSDSAHGIRSKLESQRITGELTGPELDRRHEQVNRHFLVQRRRAVEDDLDSLNPERNPLKRQSRDLIRKVEDLATRGASKNLTPEEMRQQGIAILTHAEREKNQFDRGQGSRHFITSGYKVGGREDAELESRVTGSFGPLQNQKKHENKTWEQILAEIKLLRVTLDIQAKNLGV